MPGLDWLTARPIAHRGLHNQAHGIIENTQSAIAAAIASGYGIEVDLQLTADGEAMVFHDPDLGRLTEGAGSIAEHSAERLRTMPFRQTSDRMMSLGDLCNLVAGRATLIVELKSRFDGSHALARRTADVLCNYSGPIAAMSFDPEMVTALRHAAPGLPRGIVAERRFDGPEWRSLCAAQKRTMKHLLHFYATRPHFIAYAVRDLPSLTPLIARHLLGVRLLTWTVRTQKDLVRARRYADQIIFEGLRP